MKVFILKLLKLASSRLVGLLSVGLRVWNLLQNVLMIFVGNVNDIKIVWKKYIILTLTFHKRLSN